MAHERRRSPVTALRVAGISLAVAMLAWTFRDAEPARVGALLSGLEGGALLLLLPQLCALVMETTGWRMALQAMGHQLPLAGLLRARIATEALAQTLPLGVVFCESLKPVLLARNCNAELSTSLAGMAARKWLLVASQCVYVTAFGLLAFSALTQISPQVLGSGGLPWLVLGAGGLLLTLAVVLLALLSRGRLASRSLDLLCRLPVLRPLLAAQRAKFAQTDGQLQRFFASPWSAILPLPAFLGSWLLEAAETALILYLLGVQLPWTSVGALEVSASFLRSVVCIVPAGLGVQDLSYLAFLRALGVEDAVNVTAAFLLLKRAKECCWALVGYALLAFDLRPAKRLEVQLPC